MSERVFSYYKGRTFEFKVKRHLEQLGYFVIRAARSAFPDLVCVKDGHALLVECKFNGYISKRERNRLFALGKLIDAKCAVASNEKGAVRIIVMSW